MLSKAQHNQKSPQHVVSTGSRPRTTSDPSGSHKPSGANPGGHLGASKGPGSLKQLKGPMPAANQEGPQSPSFNDPTGSHRGLTPAPFHTPQQWPIGAKLHTLTPLSASNTKLWPPRPGRPRGSCRSSFKSPLHRSRGLRKPQTNQNGGNSSSKPAVLIPKTSRGLISRREAS